MSILNSLAVVFLVGVGLFIGSSFAGFRRRFVRRLGVMLMIIPIIIFMLLIAIVVLFGPH